MLPSPKGRRVGDEGGNENQTPKLHINFIMKLIINQSYCALPYIFDNAKVLRQKRAQKQNCNIGRK